jgi:hypothetical protein
LRIPKLISVVSIYFLFSIILGIVLFFFPSILIATYLSIPTFFLFLLGPILKRVPLKKPLSYIVMQIIFVYLLIILGTVLFTILLNLKVNSLDINHDGVFSKSEQTSEQAKYFTLLINDTGRSFIFFTGIFISSIDLVIYSLLRRFFQVIQKRFAIRSDRE